MVASKHTGSGAYTERRVDASGVAAGTVGPGAVEHLLDQATRLSLRAPELALVLGERAAALSEASGSNELWVRAEGLVVLASVRLGVRAPMVGRAVAALRAAEDLGQREIAAQLRTDLALSARSVGQPLTGLAALRPALAVQGLAPALRAAALCQLVGCMGQLGRKPELDRALLEADRLCQSDEALDDTTRLLTRALLRVAVSGHRRRHGDLMGAADAARTGLGLLDDLPDQGADGGLVRSRLVLELVCALLDRGNTGTALELAQPILSEPHRAAVVAPASWLRLAVATRVYLPAGSGEAATRLLSDAVHSTERHGLHALTARLWFELANVEEQLDRPGEAIRCLHRSRAAEYVHSRARRQACALLTGEFGTGEQQPIDLDELIAPATRQSRARSALPDTLSAGWERARAATPVLALAPDPKPDPATDVVREPEPEPRPEPEPVPKEEHRYRLAPQSWRDNGHSPNRTEVSRSSGGRRRSAEGGEERAVPSSVPEARTRHDSEHGSVAARSVLDRLGISAGGQGGRRRAAGEEGATGRDARESPPAAEVVSPTPDPEPMPQSPAPRTSSMSALSALSALSESALAALSDSPPSPPPLPAERPTGRRRRAEDNESSEGLEGQETARSSDIGYPAESREIAESSSEPEADEWLPRLRLPPSLAPMEDLGAALSSAYTDDPLGSGPSDDTRAADRADYENHDDLGHDLRSDLAAGPANGTYSTSFTSAYDDNSFDRGPYNSYEAVVPSEEPPPGAGLAELLARALAEHQAGTSSAAALVKRLGSHQDEPGEARRVNGRHRDND